MSTAPIPAPPYPAALGLRREEEHALTLLLRGTDFGITDANGKPLPVKVWWRMPQREQRELTFPYILLDYLGMEFRREEEHQGWRLETSYEADTGNPLSAAQGHTGVLPYWPIPVWLRYQASVVSRTNVHDIQIHQRLLQLDLFPPRYGQLDCPSGTVRRLDVIDMAAPADGLEGGQRLFRKVWTIQISAEITNPVALVNEAVHVVTTLVPITRRP